jgi:hypothetical protein
MSVFDIDEAGQERVDEWASSNLLTDEVPGPPGILKGAISGAFEGVMRGGARAAQAIGILASPFIRADLEQRLGRSDPDLMDPYFEAVDATATNAVDYWTPNANEVGKVGQVLGGFGEIALPLMAGAGNPSLLIAAQTTGPAVDLVNQGVDAQTATLAGIAQGAGTAIGFKMPFLGKTLATKIASGALGNTAVNASMTAAQRELLLAGGYEDLAKNYDPLDVESRAIDLLTGVAFGGIDYLATRPLKPSEVAAVATANNAKHYQFDTAPGRPVNVRDSVAHQEAMEASMEQVLAGEPVAVSPEVTQADFIPRPERAPVEVLEELVALDAARAENVAEAVAESESVAPDAEPEGKPAKAPPKPAVEQAGEGGAREAHPDVAAAHGHLEDADVQVPTGALNDDGSPVSRSARELMAEAEAEVTQAKSNAIGIQAAITCLLSRGLDAT